MKKQKLLKLPVMPRRQVYPDKRKAYEAAVHEETVDGITEVALYGAGENGSKTIWK